MTRHLATAALLLLGAGRAFAQGDTLRFRDPRKADLPCEIVTMTCKQVKYTIFVNGEPVGTDQVNSMEIREIVLGANKPYDVQLAEDSVSQGKNEDAIRRFEVASRKANCPEHYKQWCRISAARCILREGQAKRAAAYIADLRRELPDTFYLVESYVLQYEACRMEGNTAGQESTLAELGREADSRAMPDWKKAAELLYADLHEAQGKWNQALAVYAKYVNDPTQAKGARLGELRCLSALAKWDDLKRKAEAILSDAKGKKPYDEQLLIGAYNARGDCALARGQTKDALLDYLRGVLVLNSSGEASREHEAAIAKAAIACARLAGELRDPDEKGKYKNRARELQADLKRYYPGSPWDKHVGDAINAIR
ncbi:MAG: hypothetical protein HYY17_03290 [Planctomycetes bacterium]|nr:hypothetical protein [Planctomycetota bacterium]